MENRNREEIEKELHCLRKKYSKPFNRKRLLRAVALILTWVINTKYINMLFSYQRTGEKVLEKYDRLAGEYVRSLEKEVSGSEKTLSVFNHEIHFVSKKVLGERRIQYIANDILRPLNLHNMTLLDVGAGELTTLVRLAKAMPELKSISALELSWSRIAVGRNFAVGNKVMPDNLVVGTATHLPFPDNSFDIIFTSHCLEQANLDKWQIIQELYRVARRYIVLLEPSWELGSKYQKRRMNTKGYLKGLDSVIKKLNLNLIRHELLPYSTNPDNRTAAYIIKIDYKNEMRNQCSSLSCPRCKVNTIRKGDYEFCRTCGRLYPIVLGIPCMHPNNSVLASRFEDFTR